MINYSGFWGCFVCCFFFVFLGVVLLCVCFGVGFFFFNFCKFNNRLSVFQSRV